MPQTRVLSLVLAILAVLAGCARPPAGAYVSVSSQSPAAQVPVGNNAVGETCSQTAASAEIGTSVDIYCGTWQQPSAIVRREAPVPANQLAAVAQSSPWRTGLEARVTCGAPAPSNILGNQPAVVMQCARKVGGWPQVALVALVGGATYEADGVVPSLPAIERSIGVLSGLEQPVAGASAAASELATRAAAQAFSSGDIGQYEQLIQIGTRANLAQSFPAAEQAFRAALTLQQKALGADDPNTVTPLTYLALQISDEGRFAEADALFARADVLAPRAADPTALPRLLHYRALHALNQGQLPQALDLLQRASAGYSAQVPAAALTARPRVQLARNGRLADLLPGQDLIVDPATQSALLGLVEVRRYLGIVLLGLGRTADSQAAIDSAETLAAANDLDRPILTARLFRTQAAYAGSRGEIAAAIAGLARSSAAFAQALPGTRPLAETEMLSADEFRREHQDALALAQCRSAVDLLRRLRAGISASLVEPCLEVYAAAAAHPAQATDQGAGQVAAATPQKLLAEMFAAAQLAQGGVTSQQIAQAAARLSANAKDPKVADAIRARQDAGARLAGLYQQRDALRDQAAQGGEAAAAATAALDKQIVAAQTAVADSDAALQAAAPNYGQLVQEVVPAADVLAALQPGESFAAITLTDQGGWIFLLRDGQIAVAKCPDGAPQIAQLVEKIRASIEPTDAGVPVFDTADANRLYHDLFGGLEAQLHGAASLIVAPTGPLLSLPFEVLLTGPADPANLAAAPFLVRQLAISHVPAAANFVSLRHVAQGSRATHPWFGFGEFRPVTLAQAQKTYTGASCQASAQLFAGLPPLPGTKRELDATRELLGGSVSDQLLGADFTAAAVQKAQLKDFRILHFATHALLPTDLACQSEPAIVTSAPKDAPDATGALLTASEVETLNLDADAVILSACNSGGPGGATAGESLSGLARAFFYAGARALVVTHWSVSDQVAPVLVAGTMRRLHDDPQRGLAAALRDAQLSLLDGAGHALPAEIAHPFYWAPFAIIGEGGGHTTTAAHATVPPARLAGL
jgi:CHAT domain-containing protein